MVNYMLKKVVTVLLLTLLLLAVSWPLFSTQLFRVHDYVHAARIAELLRGLQDGQFPVIWSQNFGYGYGMPLFEFYAPLPFYVGAFSYWLGFGLSRSVQIIFLVANIGSVVGAYYLGRKWYGRWGGLVTSAVFTFAPYRAVNLYVRGAVGEAWGMMALPWILYFTSLVLEGKKKAWFGLVLSLTVLFLSHNLTTMMFVPLSGVFILAVWALNKKRKALSLAYVAACYALAAGLSAFYVLPAFLEKHLTQIDQILGGYFWYGQHFLYIRQFFQDNWGYGGSVWGPQDDISFFLGYGQIFGICMVVGLLFLSLIGSKKIKRAHFLPILSIGLWVGALFFSLGKSQFVWDTLPFLSYIQFPWRFLGVAAVFMALAIGSLAVLLSGVQKYVVIILVLFLLTLNARYFRPESFLGKNDDFYYSDAKKIQSNMSSILPDYIPRDMLLTEPPTGLLYQPESLEYEIVVERSQEKLISLELAQDQVVTFAVAHYPNWAAEINGVATSVSQSEQGLVSVLVPAGKHRVGVFLTPSPLRRVAQGISFASFVLLLFLLLPQKIVLPNHD